MVRVVLRLVLSGPFPLYGSFLRRGDGLLLALLLFVSVLSPSVAVGLLPNAN